jgi:hypothetical protein
MRTKTEQSSFFYASRYGTEAASIEALIFSNLFENLVKGNY